ncbi:malate synthase G [Kineobactrum salinum]|uniref:Malate synthase G n=1 Tax=Kineobactrum salinum TaxID=2708301 RepID=A0A6C0TYV5_9GAMM|nr:malate synthase G [Kineobactrum salinum]QIB64956.1 malate synthase G [Kineobactrum salinum]
MKSHVDIGGLGVSEPLYSFVNRHLLPYTDLSASALWSGFHTIIRDLASRNQSLLEKRQQLQTAIDQWHRSNRGREFDIKAYRAFLEEIGYLVPEGPDFTIGVSHVDEEIATLAGPQLVVPVTNARFAINAANARWGSLYDALYGTDIIPQEDAHATRGYNPERGGKVMAYASNFLDRAIPLAKGSHREVSNYRLTAEGRGRLSLQAICGEQAVPLRDPSQFCGYLGSSESPTTLLFVHHGLHIEIQIDRSHPVGRRSHAGIRDVVLEAALTVIQDLEDAVATVDASDKVNAYRNWARLMDGTLEARFSRDGEVVHRRLNPDRVYLGADGNALTLKGRSLMMVRNVGHLTTTDCVLDQNGCEVPEGFVDAFITTLGALPNLKGHGGLENGRHGSLYIVKPKMHGPEEVALAESLFARIEILFGLPVNSLKIGVMDEERRTSANLKECIRAVKDRIVFINTGFLDRTGDEIHTDMEAGAVLPKEAIKAEPWLDAYERRNVAIGLACGFHGRAQIGKGMWPQPVAMAQMLASKQAHPTAGASCAWVPSPVAAVVHALHYHAVDVGAARNTLMSHPVPAVEELFRMPLLGNDTLDPETIERELVNNLQGILGYVVRWIDQGIGCSTVPDINDVGLMEDRATLRISSQHVANWLHHGICSEAQVRTALNRVAAIVDRQNAGEPHYRPMTPNLTNSLAFQAATDLVFKGREQPNGYTELILQPARRLAKTGDRARPD